MGIEEALEPDQARELVASNEVTVLDIRDDEEWHDKRVPGSRRVAEEELGSTIGELDDDRSVLVVCADGSRSAELVTKLREEGREVACIDGGMEAWAKEKFPVQPAPEADDNADI